MMVLIPYKINVIEKINPIFGSLEINVPICGKSGHTQRFKITTVRGNGFSRQGELLEIKDNQLVINQENFIEELIVEKLKAWEHIHLFRKSHNEVYIHLTLSVEDYPLQGSYQYIGELKERLQRIAHEAGVDYLTPITVIVSHIFNREYFESCFQALDTVFHDYKKFIKKRGGVPEKNVAIRETLLELTSLRKFYDNSQYSKPYPNTDFLLKLQTPHFRWCLELSSGNKFKFRPEKIQLLVHVLKLLTMPLLTTPIRNGFADTKIHDHLISKLQELASEKLNYYCKIEGSNKFHRLGEETVSNNLHNLLNDKNGFSSKIEISAGTGRVDIGLTHNNYPYTGARIEAKKLPKLNISNPDKPVLNKAIFNKFNEAIGQICHYLQNYAQHQGYILYYLFDIKPDDFFFALMRSITPDHDKISLEAKGRTEKGIIYTLKSHKLYTSECFPDASNRNLPIYGIELENGQFIRFLMLELSTKVQK